ncbi:sugar transferase [Puniceicoccaceae bacterium K14]|nr:sugar transferase [Puniceicoccaceae bacterium K14]
MDYLNLVHGFSAFDASVSKRREVFWEWIQRSVALLMLIVLSPLVVALFVSVKVTSPGPFLFRQKRAGLKGQEFIIYKIRTMSVGSEETTALGVTNRNPRITRVGRVLRALKLDEIPQLLNIMMGEMVFVGPRPLPLTLDRELRKSISGFAMRYQVRPGLTSIGQICIEDNAVGKEMVDDWRKRFSGELHYLKNKCVEYDILMIFMTMMYVFKKNGTLR